MKKYYIYNTCVGEICIVEEEKKIINVYNRENIKEAVLKETSIIKKASKQIEEYLDGKRKVFDFPFKIKGTSFQKSVWKASIDIPYGETKTYKEIAEIIGREKAFRAVGMANYKNPIFFLIPCHRIIGANGNLTGYALGLDIKKTLIEMEKNNV